MNKHIIMFLLDQTNPDYFFKHIDDGHAPHVSKYILGKKLANGTYENAAISKNMVTSFPSSSSNCHPMVLTGSYAGKNNIVAGQFWDLLDKKPKFYITDKPGVFAIKKYNEDYMNKYCKTIFEFFKNSASFHAVNRGADFKLLTIPNIIINFLPMFYQMAKKDEPGNVGPLAQPELWRKMFKKFIIKMLIKLKETGEMAPISFIPFLLTDQNGHKFGYESKEYKEAFSVLDYCFKLLVEGSEDKNGTHIEGLKELNKLDSIIWNIFTDHSARRIEKDKYIMIDTVLEGDVGLEIMEGFHKNPDLKKFKNLTEINMFSAKCSASMAYWFAPNGEKPNDFTKYYGEKFFREIVPKNRNKRDRKKNIDFIDYLTKKEYIQFVIIPEEKDLQAMSYELDMKKRTSLKIPRDYEIKVFSSKGSAIMRRFLKNEEIFYKYELQEGDDPFNYNKIGWEFSREYSESETLEISQKHNLPDVFHRLFGQFDCIYSPNLVITNKYEFHFWSRYDTFRNEIRNFQTHGGLFRDESIVPVTFAGTGVKGGTEIPYARNIDILPTLLTLAEVKYDSKMMDGKSITGIYRK